MLPISKVFSRQERLPSSPSTLSSSFRKELSPWESNGEAYGSADAQISSLGGKRLHDSGFRGKGMMIAVFDGGFMNVDKIPAFHGIRLAGLKDFVVPPSDNIFSEMEHGTMVLSVMAANAPNYYVGVAPEASYLLVRCEDEVRRVLPRKTTGPRLPNMPTVWG